MANKIFASVCMYCGKAENRRNCSNRPTYSPPNMGGKCPSSPDGKHKPKWEEQ